jgi:hypothetical protein
MGGIGDAFGGMGDAVGSGVSSAGNAIGQLLGGSAGAVREAGPAGIFLIVAFFVILAWVLRR